MVFYTDYWNCFSAFSFHGKRSRILLNTITCGKPLTVTCSKSAWKPLRPNQNWSKFTFPITPNQIQRFWIVRRLQQQRRAELPFWMEAQMGIRPTMLSHTIAVNHVNPVLLFNRHKYVSSYQCVIGSKGALKWMNFFDRFFQWYAWGPSHLNCRLCQSCWNYWKKYGGLKVATRLADNELDAVKKKPAITPTPNAAANNTIVIDDAAATPNNVANDLSNRSSHKCSIGNCDKEFKLKAHLARHYAQAHGIAIRSGSPRPIMKTRTAFYLHTTGATKLSRRLCHRIIRSKKAARQPQFSINLQAVKLEC